MNYKISVIVPVYNVEKYLVRCVESLLKQTLKEIEIILVDDGSPDRCPVMCDSYEKKYDNVVTIHKKNAGLGMARNSGLEIAKGEYVAFVDSDDYVEKEMYEVLYNIAKEKKADVVISGGFISEGAYRTVKVNKETENELIYEGEEVKLLALKMTGSLPEHQFDFEHAMSACKGIYKNELIVSNGVCFHSERELISEDLLFHYDIVQYAKKAIVIPKCFYHYCLNNESLTKKYYKDRFQRNVSFYKYIVELLEERRFTNDSNLYAQRLLIANARVVISQIIKYYKKMRNNMFDEILDVCNNDVLVQILNNYPIDRLPIKQKIFTYMMKMKMIRGMILLIKLNELTK